MRAFIWDTLRRATPYSVRQTLKSQRWFMPLTKWLFGHHVYSVSYYQDVERIEAASVQHMAEWICGRLAPRSVIDIGCGPGHLMKALADRSINVCGVDLSEAAIARVRERGLPVSSVDLSDPNVDLPGTRYDLAISCEVAEHLPAEHADEFVRKLCSAAPVVFLTAAEPDPSVGIGLFHVNERPNSYWIELMVRRGFELAAEDTESARRAFAAAGVVSYLAKPLVFRMGKARRQTTDRDPESVARLSEGLSFLRLLKARRKAAT